MVLSHATIREVAERANVSISTVSRILNGKSGHRASTVESVRRIASEIDREEAQSTASLQAPEGTGRRLLADMISIFEERKWAWTYHAFREWSGWSVEHSRNPAEQERALCPTDREQLLREAFSQNRK